MADTPAPDRKPVTLFRLREMLARGEKIAMLTAYDASFARLIDECGADCLLVGDSLGMVMQGHASTVPVTLEAMVYHTRCVAAAQPKAWVIGDLPFGSYQEGPEQALRSSVALMQAGAQMVKLEGGGWTAPTVRCLTERGIPVCAHLGLTPQSVHALGGYRIQGKDAGAAQVLLTQAKELYEAGAAMMVLELMPSAVAAQVQQDNPGLITIGIGAGPQTAGQVMVTQDMLRITRGKLPRFVRDFLQAPGDEGRSIEDAIRRYVQAVKDGSFPDPALHTY
jgi:3-methyl-2-oxobutanoate hydroxymethyltransferase